MYISFLVFPFKHFYRNRVWRDRDKAAWGLQVNAHHYKVTGDLRNVAKITVLPALLWDDWLQLTATRKYANRARAFRIPPEIQWLQRLFELLFMEAFNFFLTAIKLHNIVIVPEYNFKLYSLEFIYREIRMFFKIKIYIPTAIHIYTIWCGKAHCNLANGYWHLRAIRTYIQFEDDISTLKVYVASFS